MSNGEDVDTQFEGRDLVRAFDDIGEFEGEMIDFIISHWKSDPTMNQAFASGSRVLLSPYFLTVNSNNFFTLSCIVKILLLCFES